MSAGIIAWIRTVVPIAVGSLVGWLVTLGVDLDKHTEDALVVSVTGLSIAVYYTLVKLLEAKFPWVGVLLGVAKTPDTYSKGNLDQTLDGEASVVVDNVVVAPASDTPIYDATIG
jgi:hypothetical protein